MELGFFALLFDSLRTCCFFSVLSNPSPSWHHQGWDHRRRSVNMHRPMRLWWVCLLYLQSTSLVFSTALLIIFPFLLDFILLSADRNAAQYAVIWIQDTTVWSSLGCTWQIRDCAFLFGCVKAMAYLVFSLTPVTAITVPAHKPESKGRHRAGGGLLAASASIPAPAVCSPQGGVTACCDQTQAHESWERAGVGATEQRGRVGALRLVRANPGLLEQAPLSLLLLCCQCESLLLEHT